MLASARIAAAAISAVVLAVTPAAEAALIGPKNLNVSGGAATCVTETCSVANGKIPKTRIRAPYRGEIDRWKVSIPTSHDAFANDGPMRLQVLERTLNEAGFANDEYEVVSQTGEKALTPGEINAFNASLVIRKDQYVGLASTDDTEIEMGSKPDAVYLRWDNALMPDETSSKPDSAYDGSYWLFNASVVR